MVVMVILNLSKMDLSQLLRTMKKAIMPYKIMNSKISIMMMMRGTMEALMVPKAT